MATRKDEKEQGQAQEQTQGQDTTNTTPDPVEEAKKQAQTIIEEAKKQAAEIVKDGEAQAKQAIDTANAELAAQAAAAAQVPDPEEKVPVRLFKDNGRYKDDVMVAVNGRAFQIKRGETVMVPRYVAEVLERSMAQDQETANLISRESGEYEAEAAKLGLL